MVFCFVLSQRPMWYDNIFRNSLQEYSICHQVSALPAIKPKPTTSNLLCWTKPSAVCSLPLLNVTCLLPGVQWELLQRKLHSLLVSTPQLPKELLCLCSDPTWRSWTHLWPCTAHGSRTHGAATKSCLTGPAGIPSVHEHTETSMGSCTHQQPAPQVALGLWCQQHVSKKPCVHADVQYCTK